MIWVYFSLYLALFGDIGVIFIPSMSWVFLLGQNASGKSNLLDVFPWLRDMVKPGGVLQKAIEDRGGLIK